MILKLVDIKDPILRKKAKKIEKIDKKITKVISNMKETLVVQNDPEGIGLAAPQVGKSLALFLVRFEELERTIINPKVLEVKTIKKKKPKKKKSQSILEGCLSLPHYYGPIDRPNYVKVSYMDENGKHKEEVFKDFPAQIILHEVDHLEGKLFIDHILEQNAPLYKFGEDGEWEEVELA